MSILQKYLPFVKDHIAFHAKRAQEFELSSPSRSKRHRGTADTMQQMEDDVVAVDAANDRLVAENEALKAQAEKLKDQLNAALAKSSALDESKAARLSLTEEDIQGLPQQLIDELNLSAGDRAEFAILNIMEEGNGISTLDKLLIGLYRKTGEIHKRDKLISRLYRMMNKQLIYSMPGKKGVYSLEPPTGFEESASNDAQ
jgi:hypothetical protein